MADLRTSVCKTSIVIGAVVHTSACTLCCVNPIPTRMTNTVPESRPHWKTWNITYTFSSSLSSVSPASYPPASSTSETHVLSLYVSVSIDKHKYMFSSNMHHSCILLQDIQVFSEIYGEISRSGVDWFPSENLPPGPDPRVYKLYLCHVSWCSRNILLKWSLFNCLTNRMMEGQFKPNKRWCCNLFGPVVFTRI